MSNKPTFLGSHQAKENGHELTSGVVESFMTSGPDQDLAPWSVIQILQFREMASHPGTASMSSSAASVGGGGGATASKRWRVNISDGVHSMSCLLGLPLHQAVESGTLQPNAVVKVETTMTSVIQNRKVAVIVGVTLLAAKKEVIGNPIPFNSSSSVSASSTNTNTPAVVPPSTTRPPPHGPTPETIATTPSDLVTIAALSPYSNAWTIQARLTFKSEIKHWSNARGEGQVFHGILMDTSGDIRVTGFNQQVDLFYSRLMEQQVYMVRGCKVKLAQREYNPTSCPYELVLEDRSEIIPCISSNSQLPPLHLTPTPISDLRTLENGTLVDVLVIILHVQPCVPFISKQSQREMLRRDISVVDASGWQTRMSLWGKLAQDLVLEVGHVVAWKHVKVTDFNGKTLSSLHSSTVLVDPDLPSAHRLLGWYQQQQQQSVDPMTFPSTATGPMSSSGTSSSYAVGDTSISSFDRIQPSDWLTIAELVTQPDRVGWVDATLVFVRETPFTYPACPTCHKKVVTDGSSMCEKCQEKITQPQLRYIVSVCLADTSGQIWATLFNEAGEILFGQPANDLIDPHVLSVASNFQRVLVKLKSKSETYLDETRMKHTIMELIPYSKRSELWQAAAQRNSDKIKQLLEGSSVGRV